MRHLPALDGLRGLAVIGVLLFHGEFTWASGGFLGVSTFFVLSGFLITSLLVREWHASGSIRLGPFWARRFRRLLPPALLTLLLVALLWWQLGSPEQLARLRWDLLAALAYVANWRFYFLGTSYADLFTAASPLLHFWSLAIEEQFYLFYPPIVLALFLAGGRRLLVVALLAATGLSVGLTLWLGADLDRVYYGTDTRAAELLIGALLACWWSRPGPVQPPGGPTMPREGRNVLLDIAGLAALAGVFWSWGAINKTSPILTGGGLALYALATGLIIYAGTRPGLVTRLLSMRLLCQVGLVSYGLYLYHWPVFLILDEQRTGWSGVPLFLLRISVTSAIAVASYHLIEMPIRRNRLLKSDWRALGAAVASVLLIVVCAVAVTLDPPRSTIPYASVRLDDFPTILEPQPGAAAARPAETAPGSSAIATVLILGDSGTVDASPALRAVFEAAGASQVVESAFPGVGLSNPNLDWRGAYAQQIERHRPDLVIMMLGGWDTGFVSEQGDEAYTGIVDEAATLLTSGGAKLLWLSMLPGGTSPERIPDRIYEHLPGHFPGTVAYADIETALRAPAGADSLETMPGAEPWPRSYIDSLGNRVLLRKPDFWHLCPAGAQRLAAATHKIAMGLGWAGPVVRDWEGGTWREDPRYNDPPGGCDAAGAGT